MSPEMRGIIEKAYELFGCYQPGEQMLVCFCKVCMDHKAEFRLRTTPLREIRPVLLYEYNNSCHDRKLPQAQAEFRYLLPRFLELIADGRGDEVYDDYNASPLHRLKETKWWELWKKEEIDFLYQFFEQLLIEGIKNIDLQEIRPFNNPVYDKEWRLQESITDVVRLIESAGCDEKRGLAALLQAEEMAAALHIANYAYEQLSYNATISPLFLKKEVVEKLECFFYANFDKRYQKLLSNGHQLLERRARLQRLTRF